ncbi:hypothetical protein ACFW9O_19110 [Streptomyces sp. NPDC059499]|uniref:hypothetical protein n=1 Tax=Streptomyces sp. NPDC059499 TaxID=3346852 RepID=UPI0036BF9924
MNIRYDGTPYQAAVVCSGTFGAPCAWTLHIVDETGEMSDPIITWDPSPIPIQLLARYDALALYGFAVVEGGPKAWTWNEFGDDDGSYFVGMTPIRPLTKNERADSAGPAMERLKI